MGAYGKAEVGGFYLLGASIAFSSLDGRNMRVKDGRCNLVGVRMIGLVDVYAVVQCGVAEARVRPVRVERMT